MTGRSRHVLALAGAVIHGAILLGVARAALGSAALSAGGTWVAAIGASVALGAEAASQRRDDVPAQPALETVTGLLVLALVVSATLGASVSPWLLPGAVAVALGVALRSAAVCALGAGFGTRPRPGDPLVVDGLYAWLRHPSEIGLALLTGGLTLMAASVAAVIAWLATVGIAVARVRREEAELERRHGARYARYRADVKLALSRSSSKG